MPVFLFVTLATFATFQVLSHRRQSRSRDALHRELIYGFLIVLVPLLTFALATWAILWSAYPSYGLVFLVFDALPGRLASAIMLGLATGILAGILLNSIDFGANYRPFTNREKFYSALLLALLILGMGGEQLLQDAGRRVSKLSFGTAEVAFFDPAQLRRGQSEGDPSLASGIGNATAGGPAISLEVFKVLPDLIHRDELNIEAAYARSATPLADKADIYNALNGAENLAQSMIAPLGECLQEVYRQTGDIAFVRRTLGRLLPPLRDLSPASSSTHGDPTRFGQDAARALLQVWNDLFLFAHDRGPVLLSVAPQIPASKCRVLSYILCSAEHSWAVKRTNLQALTTARRLGNKTTEDKERSTTLEIDSNTLKACHARALQHQRSGALEPNGTLEREVASALQSFAERDDFYTRPYVAISIATIFAQLGQHEAGLVQLEHWFEQQKGDTIEQKWLKVRALNILIYLSEYWIRQEGQQASIVLREFHINRLDAALLLVDELFPFKTFVKKSRHEITLPDFLKTAFSRPPRVE